MTDTSMIFEIPSALLALVGGLVIMPELWRQPKARLRRRLDIQTEIDEGLAEVLSQLSGGKGDLIGRIDEVRALISAAKTEDVVARRRLDSASRFRKLPVKVGIAMLILSFILLAVPPGVRVLWKTMVDVQDDQAQSPDATDHADD